MPTKADEPRATLKGDPLNESAALEAIQKALAGQPGVLPAARALSLAGEHAAAWLALGALGALSAKKGTERRRQWVILFTTAFVSHAESVILKRIVRRPRPHHPNVHIGVKTPSKLSFPSSHATSTTATMVQLATITRSPLPLVGVPIMMLSRLVLGVHYPTDVATGATLGATTTLLLQKIMQK